MMIFLVGSEMVREILDASAQKRNLHFRRTGIFLVDFEIVDNFLLHFRRQNHFVLPPVPVASKYDRRAHARHPLYGVCAFAYEGQKPGRFGITKILW